MWGPAWGFYLAGGRRGRAPYDTRGVRGWRAFASCRLASALITLFGRRCLATQSFSRPSRSQPLKGRPRPKPWPRPRPRPRQNFTRGPLKGPSGKFLLLTFVLYLFIHLSIYLSIYLSSLLSISHHLSTYLFTFGAGPNMPLPFLACACLFSSFLYLGSPIGASCLVCLMFFSGYLFMEISARGSRRASRLNSILVVDRGPGGSKVGGLSGARFASRCRGQPPDQSAPCTYWGP